VSHLTAEISERAQALVELYPEPRSALIPLCHLAQEQDGWLRPEAMEEIAALCGVTAAEVRGTATFYDMLFTEPTGTYVVFHSTQNATTCPGAAGDLVAIRITATSPPTFTTAWCAPTNGIGAPIVYYKHTQYTKVTSGHQYDEVDILFNGKIIKRIKVGHPKSLKAAAKKKRAKK